MKPIASIFFFFCLVSLSVSIQVGLLRQKQKTHNHRRSKGRAGEDELCLPRAKKERDKCKEGLKCTAILKYIHIHSQPDYVCKKKEFMVAVGRPCVYKSLWGSQCQRDDKVHATCTDTREVWDETSLSTIEVGICKAEGQNPEVPEPALKRSKLIEINITPDENVVTTPNENVVTTPKVNVVTLDKEEEYYLDNAFRDLETKIKGKDAFTTGLLILLYFVDEDQITDESIKTDIFEYYLEEMKHQGRQCEDIEAYLSVHAIHTVSVWSKTERSQYLWLVNNKYIKGLKDSIKKVSIIRSKADAAQRTGNKLIGEFSSAGQIGVGMIKTLVDLAINFVVDRKLTNAMKVTLESMSTSEDGSSDNLLESNDKLGEKIFKKNKDSEIWGDGFGTIAKGNICKELRVNAGLNRLTDVKEVKAKKMRKRAIF